MVLHRPVETALLLGNYNPFSLLDLFPLGSHSSHIGIGMAWTRLIGHYVENSFRSAGSAT